MALIEDITACQAAEKQGRIGGERERLASLVENFHEGILVADPDGRVVLLNHRARALYGVEPDQDVLGLPLRFSDRFDAEDLEGRPVPASEFPLTRALRGEEFSDCELRFRHKVTGHEWIGCWGGRLIRDAGGKPALVVISLRETTAERRATTTARQVNAALHRLSGQLLRIQDEERRHIARELHDSTAQEMASIAMNVEVALGSPLIPKGSEEARLLTESVESARRCIEDLRTLTFLLHPPALHDLGLVPALHGWLDRFLNRTGIEVTLEDTSPPGRLAEQTEVTLFRIAQEALTNVHRHSGSLTATLRIGRQGRFAVLEIEDHGRGLPASLCAGGRTFQFGIGLMGMQERMRQLGGTLAVENTGAGVRVRATLPGRRR